jgi:hypothetical protein
MSPMRCYMTGTASVTVVVPLIAALWATRKKREAVKKGARVATLVAGGSARTSSRCGHFPS